jgi:hypothetical protein
MTAPGGVEVTRSEWFEAQLDSWRAILGVMQRLNAELRILVLHPVQRDRIQAELTELAPLQEDAWKRVLAKGDEILASLS